MIVIVGKMLNIGSGNYFWYLITFSITDFHLSTIRMGSFHLIRDILARYRLSESVTFGHFLQHCPAATESYNETEVELFSCLTLNPF